MLKCCRCGHIFDEDDAESRREYVGEFWGSPAYQDYPVCPECGSDELEEWNGDSDEKKNNSTPELPVQYQDGFNAIGFCIVLAIDAMKFAVKTCENIAETMLNCGFTSVDQFQEFLKKMGGEENE